MKRSAIFCLLIICLGLPACRGTAAENKPAAEKKPTAVTPSASAVYTLVLPSPAPARTETPLPSQTRTLPPSATAIATRSPSPTRSSTPSPSLTPSPTSSPTLRLVPVLEPSVELMPGMISKEKPIHDLIVFGSNASYPFAGGYSDKWYMEEGGDNEAFIQFYAVATDGSKAGLLGGIDYGFFFNYPPEIYTAITVIWYSYRLNTEILPASELPEECFLPLEEDEFPCSEFQFSPNEEYYGYRYQYGVDLRIVDVQTGEIVFSSDFWDIEYSEWVHFFLFTPDNRVLMGSGGAEGGGISLIDPKNRTEKYLGAESVGNTVTWNNSRTAFAVLSYAYPGMWANLWGYNLQNDRIFLSDHGVLSNFVWTPDGSSILYQKSDSLGTTEPDITTYSVMRLMLVSINGTPHQILGHYNYDFHLCDSVHDYNCGWVGDWFPVRRIPADERSFGYGEHDGCFMYGVDCPDPAEHFLFNWRTAELVPPDSDIHVPETTPISTLTPTPTSIPGPDLSREPVYAHPSGTYAFYVGLDGTSLWLVPQVGQAELWVANGENFIYIP